MSLEVEKESELEELKQFLEEQAEARNIRIREKYEKEKWEEVRELKQIIADREESLQMLKEEMNGIVEKE